MSAETALRWQIANQQLKLLVHILCDPGISDEERDEALRRARYWTKKKDEIALGGYREEIWNGEGKAL